MFSSPLDSALAVGSSCKPQPSSPVHFDCCNVQSWTTDSHAVPIAENNLKQGMDALQHSNPTKSLLCPQPPGLWPDGRVRRATAPTKMAPNLPTQSSLLVRHSMQWCTTLPRTCHGPFTKHSVNARQSLAVASVGGMKRSKHATLCFKSLEDGVEFRR